MDTKRQREVFEYYREIYKTILSNIYPAKHSTGFPERNLSVNFSKAYETVAANAGETAVSWFEMQFGEKNNLHVDAVIINETVGDMLILESKRFNSPLKKAKQIVKDINRIYDFVLELQNENKQKKDIIRIDLSKINHCYGIILADVWTETDIKKDILRSYIAGLEDPCSKESFLNKYCINDFPDREFSDLAYDVCNMKDTFVRDYNYNKYNLVSFIWKIS